MDFTLAPLERDTAVSHAPPPLAPALGSLPFQPELFFLGRTEGAGVVRDPFDRIVRRCKVTTEGARHGGVGAVSFEEVFTYDDGEVDVWRWAMSPGRDGRYVAAEAKAGPGIAGERAGADYRLSFRRPVGAATGVFAPRFSTRFTMLAPDLALKSARMSIWGLPLAALVVFHRKVES